MIRNRRTECSDGSLHGYLIGNDIRRVAPMHLPAAVSASALGSVGGAIQVASRLPASSGNAVADAARHAFFHGADAACIIGAVIAAAGAVMAARFLPAGMRLCAILAQAAVRNAASNRWK